MKFLGIGTNNNLFNAAVINRQFNKSNENTQNGLSIQQGNRDSVFISGQGKQKSIVQQLMNQKQMIQECKDAEMERGLEDGYVNQDKLDEYDEQLEMIDKQIAEATVEQSTEDTKEKSSDNNNIMTEEKYEQHKLMNIMDSSSQVDQIEVVSKVKGKLDGEVNVLKAEIELDSGRVLESQKALESKKDRINEIKSKISDLFKQIGDKVANINDNITEIENSVNDIDEESDTLNTDENKMAQQTILGNFKPTKLDIYV